MKHYDIFCKIVDNFGDIGVCWRLAKQLEHEHGIHVRLWIDDLNIAKKLITSLDIAQRTQLVGHITIAVWDADTSFDQAAEVIIEAFGCQLPESYLQLMQPDTIWINLEYLSAERWVEGFHARNSKRGNLTRHFFFPGFTKATGGLLREHDIIENNQKIASDDQLQSDFFRQLNLKLDDDSGTLKISLFSYPNAPISDLLSAISDSTQKISCYVPTTSILPKIAEFFGKESIAAGDHLRCNNLDLHVLPFLSQADYDKLLASCDINFVRGEDSWIRAIWAGRPFIWQPYLQTEDTHLIKLKAFLDVFYSGCEAAAQQATIAMHSAWASPQVSASTWQDYLGNIGTLKTLTAQQSSALATQPDLATNLVIYIEKLHRNKI
ncbi:MAG TPA: elongation factor P maturation arginine rhamnosyltransferase EarP [Methylotenera sp.]|nr:elongation factor P maturation arginine rhamnosyltransferase EarP [Methylotenera sp.]